MSGPPRKPTRLRLVTGNASKRPLPANEPKPEKRVPPTPKHFSKQAKYWFKRIADDFDAMGVLTIVDAKALELLVDTYVEWRKHCDVLDAEGYTYSTTSMVGGRVIKAHPASIMKSDAAKRLRAMLAEFGATPASRSKVEIAESTKEDPLEAFLKKRK